MTSKTLTISFLIIICTASILYSQDINRIDSKGNKQGYWKIYQLDTVQQYDIAVARISNSTTISKTDNEYPSVKYFHVTCVLISERIFMDNKKNGVWKYYDHNTNYEPKKVLTRQNFVKEEIIKTTYRGDSAEFINSYYQAPIILEKTYKEDKLNGIYKSYYQNGNTKLIAHFNEGNLADSISYFYQNGKIQFSGILDNDPNYFEGTEYYESGSKKREKRLSANYILNEWIKNNN